MPRELQDLRRCSTSPYVENALAYLVGRRRVVAPTFLLTNVKHGNDLSIKCRPARICTGRWWEWHMFFLQSWRFEYMLLFKTIVLPLVLRHLRPGCLLVEKRANSFSLTAATGCAPNGANVALERPPQLSTFDLYNV